MSLGQEISVRCPLCKHWQVDKEDWFCHLSPLETIPCQNGGKNCENFIPRILPSTPHKDSFLLSRLNKNF